MDLCKADMSVNISIAEDILKFVLISWGTDRHIPAWFEVPAYFRLY